MPNPSVLNGLARSFVAGEPTVEGIVARGSRVLGRSWHWLRPLARRYVDAIGGKTHPRHRDAVQFLLKDAGFQAACSKYFRELSVEQWFIGPHEMEPVPAAQMWDVPAITSAGALADWLLLSVGDLEWFADLKGLEYKKNAAPLRHYRYRVSSKRSGAIRLIEAPKPRLKKLQRQILAEILEKIPPHAAAHGFLKSRSIKTFVAPHVGRRVVLRMDLQDFFGSISAPRIQALFRTMGYPESVADLLGGICTNASPRDIWNEPAFDINPQQLREARTLYAQPHLPQGAPTSPALANLCAYRVDCRLAGLAKAADAEYTRYADDLAFSGSEAFERRVERFSMHVAVILFEEGFAVHHRKTRIMRRGVRQHLAGLVTNQHMNIVRSDFDRLKATLTNCVRLGPTSQNRSGHSSFRSHLEGRVGFLETINPTRGKRLRAIFDRIQWE